MTNTSKVCSLYNALYTCQAKLKQNCGKKYKNKGNWKAVILEHSTQALIKDPYAKLWNLENDQINVVFFAASDFEVGECWGYNRFFRLDLLVSWSVNSACFPAFLKLWKKHWG